MSCSLEKDLERLGAGDLGGSILDSVDVCCDVLALSRISSFSGSFGRDGDLLDSGDCVPGGGGGDSFLIIDSGGIEFSLNG